jgi:hypothetical protein
MDMLLKYSPQLPSPSIAKSRSSSPLKSRVSTTNVASRLHVCGTLRQMCVGGTGLTPNMMSHASV